MTTSTNPRRAVAGRCQTCHLRLVRGDDGTGNVGIAELNELNADTETEHHAKGIPTYRLSWHGAMVLTRRTDNDIRIDPAGFREGRILSHHQCTETEHE